MGLSVDCYDFVRKSFVSWGPILSIKKSVSVTFHYYISIVRLPLQFLVYSRNEICISEDC